MDLGLLAAVVMLVVWAIGSLAFDGPGWIHLLLSVGVMLLIWRIVVRSTPPKGSAVNGAKRER